MESGSDLFKIHTASEEENPGVQPHSFSPPLSKMQQYACIFRSASSPSLESGLTTTAGHGSRSALGPRIPHGCDRCREMLPGQHLGSSSALTRACPHWGLDTECNFDAPCWDTWKEPSGRTLGGRGLRARLLSPPAAEIPHSSGQRNLNLCCSLSDLMSLMVRPLFPHPIRSSPAGWEGRGGGHGCPQNPSYR